MPLSPKIQAYVDQEILTFAQAIRLDCNGRKNLASKAIRSLLSAKKLTVEQAIGLNPEERQNLEPSAIRALIFAKKITVEQALRLSENARENLQAKAIRGFILNGTLPLEQAMGLHMYSRWNLGSTAIRGLITNGTLTLEQAIGLHIVGHENLASKAIRGFLANGMLSMEQAIDLHGNVRWNLESEAIRGLIADSTLTLAQAIALSPQGRTALDDADTRQRLRDGRLTVRDFMDEQLPLGIQGTPIHGAQSTHTASVHQTASASAQRLHDRYAGNMTHETLHTIKRAMDALPRSAHNEAAKRCIERLAALETSFTDPRSGVTLHELLALSWLAMHDDAVRMGTLEDAIALCMEGLYEIQRGYNVSTGKDSGEEDRPICLAGTFHKLLEKLQGVHPDVEILVITHALAALKLPIVVQEEAMKYLEERADPCILSAVQEGGVEIMWEDIKGKVAERVFGEFASLYDDQDDAKFRALIDTGKDVDLRESLSFPGESFATGGMKF